jgi:hypothetical protein
MLTVLTPRSSRNVALGVAISGASGMAGILEPLTAGLSLLLVVLSAHFFGRNSGRLAAGFASLAIAGVTLASSQPPFASSSIARSAIAIAVAWLCAELVSRHPLSDPMTRLKNAFDEQIRQRIQTLQSISGLVPGHMWIALPNGYLEYLSPTLGGHTSATATYCEPQFIRKTCRQTTGTGTHSGPETTRESLSFGSGPWTASTGGSSAVSKPYETTMEDYYDGSV